MPDQWAGRQEMTDGEDIVIEEAVEDIKRKEQVILAAEQKILSDEKDILEGEAREAHERVEFHIQIDREHYVVYERKMTGTELRHVPPTPIGSDRDLFEVVPGGSDRKIC